MHAKVFWAGIIVIVAGALAYWFFSATNPSPAITVLSPTAGDKWQPGEEHAIRWSTQGIPQSDKISITIRRVPPPPLAAEGQEFDPVVLYDLPNTGSTTWKISPMYPDGTYVLGLQAYASRPITQAVSAESAQFTITHPILAPDLYPLYTKADWQKPEVESFSIGTTTYTGASVMSASLDAGMDPGSVLTLFEQYYDKKLRALGWSISNDLAAGGHVGGQTGYRKGTKVILTRFAINYHTRPENAPTECPCDVTLSLFSN